MRVDDNLVDGLDDGVAVPEFVVPFLNTAMQEVMLNHFVMTTTREHHAKQAMHYCMPDDPALPELIRQNLIRKREAIYGRAPHDDTLTFAFDKIYIDKRNGRVTRLIDYKGIKIRGIMCPFRVTGNPALIQIGYECGFGDKNNADFGMAEV